MKTQRNRIASTGSNLNNSAFNNISQINPTGV